MIAFLKLVRWKNLLIIALAMFAMRYAVTLPIYEYFNVSVNLSQSGFLFLVLSVIFLMSGGNVINDYFDRRSDMINRPDDVLVVFSIRRRKVILMHIFLSLFGIICGLIVSIKIHRPAYVLIFIFASIILWLYSANFKKKTILGNFVAAILTASVPFSVGFFEYFCTVRDFSQIVAKLSSADYINFYMISGFSAFAFLYSFILGIIKACSNYEGDKELGRNSISVKIGKVNTNYLLGILSLISTILLVVAVHFCLPKIYFLQNSTLNIWYIYVFLILPSLVLAISSFSGTQKRKYKFLITLTKAIMFFGIFFSFIFSFSVYGFIY